MRKKKLTLAGQARRVKELEAIVQTMSVTNRKNLKQLEAVEKHLTNAEGELEDYKRIVLKLETVVQFRLDTAWVKPSSGASDPYGNPIPECDQDCYIPEEQSVLRKLLEIVTHINSKWDYSHGEFPLSPRY